MEYHVLSSRERAIALNEIFLHLYPNMSVIKEECDTPSDFETVTGCNDIVDSKDKLHIILSSQKEGHDRDNASFDGSNSCSNSVTFVKPKPISPVWQTIENENWIKEEPCSSADSSPTLSMGAIMIDSNVDEIVSGNSNLENNDIAREPMRSNNTPRKGSNCERVKCESAELLLAKTERGSGSNSPVVDGNQMSEVVLGNILSTMAMPGVECNFACCTCLEIYSLSTAVKRHMFEKHPQSRDLCAFVPKANNDSDNNSQLVWFCPRKCEYLTLEYNALSEHLVTCQKPDSSTHHNRADYAEVRNNHCPFELKKEHGADTSAEGLMVRPRQTVQGSHKPGQASEHDVNTLGKDLKLKDIPTCQPCDSAFSTNLLLERHEQDCHEEQQLKSSSEKKPFECNHCSKTFSHRRSLYMHMRTHTGEKPFKCIHCDMCFSQSGCLRVHMRTHTGEKPFKCSHCDKCFSQSGNLHKHMKIHSGEKLFECGHCDKGFSDSGGLHKHMKRHVKEKPFKCGHCAKSFSRSDNLRVHMRTHTGEKPFVCSQCNKSFSQSGYLHFHMKIHTGERPFKCIECNKSFRRNCGLSEHMRTHTGEKPFKCSYCDKRFGDGSSLRGHMRLHTGEKPFECSQCNQSFIRGSDLRRHMTIHTGQKPFKCSHCDQSFMYSHSFREHMRTHTGEKPFKCGQCDKSFMDSDHCYEHVMKTHALEKPFKCTHCSKTYSRSYCLSRHMRTHHIM